MAFLGKHVILAICSVLGDLPLLSTWLTYLLLLWVIDWQEHAHKAPRMSSGLNQKLLGTQLCVDEIQKNLNPAKQSSSFVCVEDSNEAHPCSLGEQATFLCNIGVGQTSCLMWQGNRDSENCSTHFFLETVYLLLMWLKKKLISSFLPWGNAHWLQAWRGRELMVLLKVLAWKLLFFFNWWWPWEV
jgi:hypothetical protein